MTVLHTRLAHQLRLWNATVALDRVGVLKTSHLNMYTRWFHRVFVEVVIFHLQVSKMIISVPFQEVFSWFKRVNEDVT